MNLIDTNCSDPSRSVSAIDTGPVPDKEISWSSLPVISITSGSLPGPETCTSSTTGTTSKRTLVLKVSESVAVPTGKAESL